MGQSPSSEDCNIDGIGIPFLQGNAEFGTYSPTAKNYCPIPKKIADKGDLLFSVRAPVGALNYADMQYGIGRGLCSLKSRSSINSSFLWWVLPTYKYQLDAIATGSTFEAVSAEEVANLKFPLPTIVEQQKIANFLDHETAQIDTLIAKQEKLIELLKEKRQAVISHAVTKGLDPNVPMKDSGVAWLGEVPEHWQLVPLKYLCTFSGGGTPTKDNLSYWTDGNIPWVSPKDMKTFWISKTQDYITEKAVKESSTNTVEQNSLLMVVRSGILQRTIPIAINTVPVTMNQDMKALFINMPFCPQSKPLIGILTLLSIVTLQLVNTPFICDASYTLLIDTKYHIFQLTLLCAIATPSISFNIVNSSKSSLLLICVIFSFML